MKTELENFEAWVSEYSKYNIHFTKTERRLMFSAWQAAKANVIPEGYCIVPKEPTGDMIVFGSIEHRGYDEIDSKAIYKAMIEVGELK